MFIRDALRVEFDDFFNSLLASIRNDWNLFSVEETIISETKKFNDSVSQNLEQIIKVGQNYFPHQDIKKFYETLSEAQTQVQQYKENWYEYEKNISDIMENLK